MVDTGADKSDDHSSEPSALPGDEFWDGDDGDADVEQTDQPDPEADADPLEDEQSEPQDSESQQSGAGEVHEESSPGIQDRLPSELPSLSIPTVGLSGKISNVEIDLDGLQKQARSVVGTQRKNFAELVDGATVYLIDPSGRRRPISSYRLATITAPAYPQPIILKCDEEVSIPARGCLSPTAKPQLIRVNDKRITVRPAALVPPERVQEVGRGDREQIPEGLRGETVPERPVQNQRFLDVVLDAVDDRERVPAQG